MIEKQIEQQYNNQSLTKLSFDTIKPKDLKFIFEVLNTIPQNRTIADLDNLVKIMLHIQPIKKIQNLSAIYLLCQKMSLQKYKSKDLIFEQLDKSQSLYIILNGKIAFYKKSQQYFDNDQVIFINSGSCFGKLYDWKIKFVPICVEETLFAIINQNQINKIPMHLSYQYELMIAELKNCQIFNHCNMNSIQFKQAARMLVLNKVPSGNYLIRDGQIPKGIFYIMKGIAKNIINKNDKIYEVKRFTQGQYSPRCLKNNYKYDLITQTSCQIIVIPIKILKIINSPILNYIQTQKEQPYTHITKQLKIKNQWKKYKQNYLNNLINKPIVRKEKNIKWKN